MTPGLSWQTLTKCFFGEIDVLSNRVGKMIHLGFPKMHSAPRCLFFFTGRKPQRSWRRQQKLKDGELNFESWERRTRGRRKAPDHETRDSGDRTARSHVSRQVWGKAISGHSRGGSLVCTSFIVSEERSLVRPRRQMLLEISRYSLTGQRFQTYEASKPTSFLHTALIRRKRVLVSPQNLLSLFSLWKILNGGGGDMDFIVECRKHTRCSPKGYWFLQEDKIRKLYKVSCNILSYKDYRDKSVWP